MIAGEATQEELVYLDDLIKNNPEWKTSMENVQELWNSKPRNNGFHNHQKNEDAYLAHINRLKEKVSDFEAEEVIAFDDHFVLQDTRKPFYKRVSTYVLATAAVLMGFIAFSFWGNNTNKAADKIVSATDANEINVGKGSRSKIQLPDGSSVWINSGSKLTYGKTFTGNTREIKLDGEAYFEVVRDPEHPFIVHTSGIDIKVLGTAFNVKAYDVEPTIEATLVHGSIEVIKKDQQNGSKIMLKPHEKLIFSKYTEPDKRDQRANVVVTSRDTDASFIMIKALRKNIADTDIVETAWVYNKLVFEDERFEDLAQRMEKWFNVKIIIGNDKLKNSKVTGTFINETIEQAMRELQFLLPFNYSMKGNEIMITRK